MKLKNLTQDESIGDLNSDDFSSKYHYKDIHIIFSEGLLEEPIYDFIKKIPPEINIVLWSVTIKTNNFLFTKLLKMISIIEKINFLSLEKLYSIKAKNTMIRECAIEDFPRKFLNTYSSNSLKLFLVNPDLLNIDVINSGGNYIATNINPKTLSIFSLKSTLDKNDYKELNIISSVAERSLITMKHGLTSLFLLNKFKIEYAILDNFYSFLLMDKEVFDSQTRNTLTAFQDSNNLTFLSLARYFLNTIILKVKGRIKSNLESSFNIDSLSESWSVGCLDNETGKTFTLPGFFNYHLADPFIFEHKGISYCFVEKFDFKSNGEIHVYDLDSRKYLGLALKEVFHLSFPFIFTHNNNIYMLPETSANNDIRLYEAKNFPFEWSLISVLKSNIRAADSLIFQNENKWFLVTSIPSSIVDNDFHSLKIFTSDNLFGPFEGENSMQNIFNDSVVGRSAGYFKKLNSHFRVSQYYGYDCYGKSAQINKINTITENSYIEEESMLETVGSLKKCANELAVGFKRTGFHHISMNDKYTVFDFKIKPKLLKMISISQSKMPWI